MRPRVGAGVQTAMLSLEKTGPPPGVGPNPNTPTLATLAGHTPTKYMLGGGILGEKYGIAPLYTSC